jgi:hypothetical protein
MALSADGWASGENITPKGASHIQMSGPRQNPIIQLMLNNGLQLFMNMSILNGP